MFRKSLYLLARNVEVSFSKIKTKRFYRWPAKGLVVQNFKQLPSVPQLSFTPCRYYAKGKDIKKNKKTKFEVDENELGEVFDIQKLYKDLSKPVDLFKEELILYASLRSNQTSIENFRIKFEGENYVLQDLAEISKKNPKLYVLDFEAFPQALPVAKAALEKSEMNLTIQQDGGRLFIPVPKVTKDHREVLAKKSKAMFVKCKDSVRDIQNRYLKKLKNVDSLGEDARYRITGQLNELGNAQIKLAEEMLKQKQEELLNY